jgi:hypothetical protein
MHSLALFNICYICKTLHNTLFRKPALLLSLGKEAPNLMNPLDQAILSHWAPHKHLACLEKSLKTA